MKGLVVLLCIVSLFFSVGLVFVFLFFSLLVYLQLHSLCWFLEFRVRPPEKGYLLDGSSDFSSAVIRPCANASKEPNMRAGSEPQCGTILG